MLPVSLDESVLTIVAIIANLQIDPAVGTVLTPPAA
jgi:hypothetical protein